MILALEDFAWKVLLVEHRRRNWRFHLSVVLLIDSIVEEEDKEKMDMLVRFDISFPAIGGE
jgi:hypothetical protein